MGSLRVIKAVELLKDLNTLFVGSNSLGHVTKLEVNIGNLGIAESNIFMNRPENLNKGVNFHILPISILRLARFGWIPREFRGLLRTFLQTSIEEQGQFGP